MFHHWGALCQTWLIAVSIIVGCSLQNSFQCHAHTLITFDVDGTLVKGSGQRAEAGAHARAFSYACGKVLGDGSPVRPVATALRGPQYHGSTDGLILLRLARAELAIEPSESFPRMEELMNVMYDFIAELDDEEVADGINVLPGVLENLSILSKMKDKVSCGLVTGNVEGIARRKMRAVGVLDTNVLAPPAPEQLQRKWPGADHLAFLGGFGSDFCSGDIDDPTRNYLDRSEQIQIATQRCRQTQQVVRVVHVGDAPADVLAAKAYAERLKDSSDDADANLCIGMVAVATGAYSATELRDLAGEPQPGRWEPVILENGMADPNFLDACGIQ